MSAPGPLDPRQRQSDQFETIETHLDGRQAQIHTALPGQIVAFDPAKMTATVQPAIQGVNTRTDGSRVPTTIAPIRDVPVHFPSGGGFTLTFPVKPGDECLIVFMERSIDSWFQQGGVREPADWRMHDINDCVVHVGMRSQPHVLGGFSATGVQLRSDAGTDYVQLDATGITLNTLGVLNLRAASINVTNTSGGLGTLTINANIATTGTLTNNATNVSSTHKHSDPQGGSVGTPF